MWFVWSNEPDGDTAHFELFADLQDWIIDMLHHTNPAPDSISVRWVP